MPGTSSGLSDAKGIITERRTWNINVQFILYLLKKCSLEVRKIRP